MSVCVTSNDHVYRADNRCIFCGTMQSKQPPIVPKPQGFDLNIARCDRDETGEKWSPADALYNAYLAIEKGGSAIDGVVVIWRECAADKRSYKLRFSQSGPRYSTHALLLDALVHWGM